MKFWAQAEEGFREELASDTELDLQWRGRRIFLAWEGFCLCFPKISNFLAEKEYKENQ